MPPLMLIGDPAALRRKLTRKGSGAKALYDHIRRLPDAAGNTVVNRAFLYAITGKEAHGRAAFEALDRRLDGYVQADASSHIHFHTWCNAAPLARMAIAWDWVADAPFLTDEDRARVKERLLDYTHKHPWNILRSRVRTFDNQFAAMAFCCTVVGHLFGQKRGADLRAQRLLADGLMRFPDLFALSPPAGYSFEGSTYFARIVIPTTALFCAVVEAIRGTDVFHTPHAPSGCAPRNLFRLYERIIGPTGLLPPWDHYGWMRCCSVLGLAYLAAKTGDPHPLQIIERLGLAQLPAGISWGHDDKVWAAIFWPADLEVPAAGRIFSGWAAATVGGAVVSETRQWRLFQCWDRCAGGLHCGRAQVNPNHIALDLWGSPVLTDGVPDKETGCPLFDYPREAFQDQLGPDALDSIEKYQRSINPDWTLESWLKGVTAGTLGAANAIVIGDDGHYAPETPREGKLTAAAALPGLQLVAAEVADTYRPHYPVRSMVRTSLLVRDDYFLLVDRIAADASLPFTWQAFARGAVAADGKAVRIETAEGVALDVVPLAPGLRPTLTPAPGFPRQLEGASTRIRYQARGKQAVLPFLLYPQRLLEPALDLAAGWHVARASREAGLARGFHRGVDSGKPLPIGDCGPAGARRGKDGWVWAGRRFRRPAGTKGKRLLLHIPTAIAELAIWCNGTPVPTPTLAGDHDAPEGRLAPLTVDLTPFLRAQNTLVLAGRTAQGLLAHGAVALATRRRRGKRPRVTRRGPTRFAIAGAWGTDEIALNPDGGTVETAGLATDAAALVAAADGTVTALRATRIDGADLTLRSDRPIDIDLQPSAVTFGDLSGPEEVEVRTAGFFLRLRSGGVVDVDLHGEARPEVAFTLGEERPVFVNGHSVAATRDPFTGHVDLPAAAAAVSEKTDPALPAHVRRQESAVRRAAQGGPKAVAHLIQRLRGDTDWTVRLAAAEALGRSGVEAAVKPLLEVLAEETPERIYPPLAAQDPHPDDASSNGPAGKTLRQEAKRHRLKAVAIQALGHLRAPAAVPALAAILRDKREFYPVHSLACWALGRIGDRKALPALRRAADYPEVNTRMRARDAIARITTGHPATPAYPDSHAEES